MLGSSACAMFIKTIFNYYVINYMRKKLLFTFFLLVSFFSFNNLVFGNEFININVAIDVPKTCTAVDTDLVSHSYGEEENSYLGICALQALLEKGEISSIGLSNQYPEMGLFVLSFNGLLADSNSQYWALYKNNSYAENGITTLSVEKDDILSFKLSNFASEEIGDFVIIKINSLIAEEEIENENNGGETGENIEQNEEEEVVEEVLENNENINKTSSSSSRSYIYVNNKNFDIEKAFEFIISKQASDGSFVENLYTDWSAIALSLIDSGAKEKIKKYILSNDFDSLLITDYERRAMALMSLGINPYNGTNVNYIKKIVDSFDGEQIGDPSFINDDIFGILVLKNAGYKEDDKIIKKVIFNIIKNYENKNFESLDIASALLQSLGGLENIDGINNLKEKIKDYILSNISQINNSYTASWVMQSSVEINKSKEFLINNQNEDGGLNSSHEDINSRIWATSYAIPAILNKNWDAILTDFEKIDFNENIVNKNIEKNNVALNKEEKKVALLNNLDKKNEIKEILIENNLENHDNNIENIKIENEKLIANANSNNSKLDFANYLLIYSICLLLVVLFIKFLKI